MPHQVSPAGHLVGRKAATAYRAIYGVNTEAWIGWDGAPAGVGEVPAPPYADRPVKGSFPGPLLQLAACKAGLGLAWLPCFLADSVLPRLSDPIAAAEDEDDPAAKNGRLITLIELYAIQPINPPSAERFRFENQDDEVNFTNETDRYIEQFGVQLTERELRQLRR